MKSRTVCPACSWCAWTLSARAFRLPQHTLSRESSAAAVLVLLVCSGVGGGCAWCGQQGGFLVWKMSSQEPGGTPRKRPLSLNVLSRKV